MIDILNIDKTLLEGLLEQARGSERLRMNYDLRTSTEDTSQRMLNALQPGTEVPIQGLVSVISSCSVASAVEAVVTNLGYDGS